MSWLLPSWLDPKSWLICLIAAGALWGAHALDVKRNVRKASEQAELRGRAAVQGRWDEEKLKLQAAALEAARRYAAEADRISNAQRRADDENAARERVRELAAARSSDELAGLRRDLALYRVRAAGDRAGQDPAAAGERPAVSDGWDALEQCAGRYRDLAEHADRDRSAGLSCEQRYDALIPPEPATQP